MEQKSSDLAYTHIIVGVETCRYYGKGKVVWKGTFCIVVNDQFSR